MGALTAASLALVAVGWAPDLERALGALGDPALLPARVAAADRGSYDLIAADGPLTAGLAGALRHAAGPGELPVVGDWVAVEPDPATIHPVLESRLFAALQLIGRLDFIRSAPHAIRVIEEEYV